MILHHQQRHHRHLSHPYSYVACVCWFDFHVAGQILLFALRLWFGYNPCLLQSYRCSSSNMSVLCCFIYTYPMFALNIMYLISDNDSIISPMTLSSWPVFNDLQQIPLDYIHSWLVVYFPGSTDFNPTTAASAPHTSHHGQAPPLHFAGRLTGGFRLRGNRRHVQVRRLRPVHGGLGAGVAWGRMQKLAFGDG